MQLVEDHIEKYSDPNSQSPKGRPSAFPNPLRLTAHHFASHIPLNAIKKSQEDNVLFAVQRGMTMVNGSERKPGFGVRIVELDFV